MAFENRKETTGVIHGISIWRKAKLWALSANPVPVSLSQLFQSWVCSRKMGDELPAAGFLWMAKRLQTWEKKEWTRIQGREIYGFSGTNDVAESCSENWTSGRRGS